MGDVWESDGVVVEMWESSTEPGVTFTTVIREGDIVTGGSGVDLSDATPAALGTAAPGVGTEASRADHVHGMPTAADVGAAASSRSIIAGSGLSGGGDLTVDRTISADFGSGAGKVTEGNDARLSDARTPTAHASSHGDGGTDEIAVDASQITTGTVAQARLGTGSGGTGSKFLADDQTWRRAVAGHSQAIVSNAYITGPGMSSASNTYHLLPSVGRQVWHPIWLEAGTYDRLAVITTVAGTSTWRLGLDSATTDLHPGVNVLDAGVVDMSVTPGLLSCTVSFTVTVAGWFFARVKCETFTSAPTAYVVDGVVAQANTLAIPGWPTINVALPARQHIGLWTVLSAAAGPFGPPPSFTGDGGTGIGYTQSCARLYIRKSA